MSEIELHEEGEFSLEDSRDDKRVILGSTLFDVFAILTLFGGVVIGLFFLFETEDYCSRYYSCSFEEKRPLFVSGVILLVSSIFQAILFRALAAYLRTKISFQNRQLAAIKQIQRMLIEKENN